MVYALQRFIRCMSAQSLTHRRQHCCMACSSTAASRVVILYLYLRLLQVVSFTVRPIADRQRLLQLQQLLSSSSTRPPIEETADSASRFSRRQGPRAANDTILYLFFVSIFDSCAVELCNSASLPTERAPQRRVPLVLRVQGIES
jgi:hypothetical protein